MKAACPHPSIISNFIFNLSEYLLIFVKNYRNDSIGMNKCKSNIVTLSGTLCLTFLLSLFLTSDISLFAFMSAMNVGNDFKISDFYSRVANTFQQNVNEDIVIIDIADCSREQIAETI